MLLDWDFYFDSWLIDKIPNGYKITIEEHPNGLKINPSELTCYFGANPIYLYGEGKVLHEVMMSPRGFIVYPDFLQRPGFEFVDELSFSIDFPEENNFFGDRVIDKHVGNVRAKDYFSKIIDNVYGTIDGYTTIKTPSSELRRLNVDDYEKIQKGVQKIQIYDTIEDMKNDNCVFFTTMGIQDDSDYLTEEIHEIGMKVVSPGPILQRYGVNNKVIHLRYSYVVLPEYLKDVLSGDSFQILFTTLKDFRFGTLIDFGATELADGNNYGFRVSIYSDFIEIIANNGTMQRFTFPYKFDTSMPHKIMIIKEQNKVSVIVDNTNLGIFSIDGSINIVFPEAVRGYISRNSENKGVSTGDIENLAIFAPMMSLENQKKFLEDELPVFILSDSDKIDIENTPVALSYSLTYQKPSKIITGNHFGGDIESIYLSDKRGVVEKISKGNKISSDAKSFWIDNGYKIENVVTLIKDGQPIDNFPALTKLTSDTHIPLRIFMRFKVPEFWDRNLSFNISLVLRPIANLLRYSYKKPKTDYISS